MEIENNPKRRILFAISGAILTPIILCLFIVDRFIMVFLVMTDAPTLKNYFNDVEYILISGLRNLVLAFTILIIKWLWF